MQKKDTKRKPMSLQELWDKVVALSISFNWLKWSIGIGLAIIFFMLRDAKQEIQELRASTKQEIQELKASTKQDKEELKQDIQKLETDIKEIRTLLIEFIQKQTRRPLPRVRD